MLATFKVLGGDIVIFSITTQLILDVWFSELVLVTHFMEYHGGSV